MVILHARVAIKPERRERWLALVGAVTAPSRAETRASATSPKRAAFNRPRASLEGAGAHLL